MFATVVNSVLRRPIGKPEAMKAQPLPDMEKYVALANELGVAPAGLQTNRFLTFMKKADLPIYHLPTVIRYMNQIAKRDGNGSGWVWRVMRNQDWHRAERFGMPISPFSDAYTGHVYERPIPYRVLQRAQFIEQNSPIKPIYMISDYATRDDIAPDPFLLAFFSQTERFVVDFWDEPGFGLSEMLQGNGGE